MKLDAIEIMRFQPPDMCLSGSYDIVEGDLLYHVKNPQGFPIDLRRFDNDFAYDQQTEASWKDPEFIKLHLGNGGKGNRMALRWITQLPMTIVETTSPLIYIKNGQSDYQIANAGPLKYVWNKPFMKDWGEDVGNVLTYPVDYFWSGLKNREQYFFAPPFGLVKWNHMELQLDGSYKVVRPEDDPPVSNKLQTIADWRKTYPKLTKFGYNLPFKSPVRITP